MGSSFDELGIGPESEAAMKDFNLSTESLKQLRYQAEKPNMDAEKLEKLRSMMEQMEGRKKQASDGAFVVQADGRVTRAEAVDQNKFDDKIPVVRRSPKETNIVSPTRTYVIVCRKPNNTGCFLRRITLPFDRPNVRSKIEGAREEIENTAVTAIESFLSEFDRTACVEHVMTWEDYINVKDCNEMRAEKELAEAEAAIEQEAKGEQNGSDLYPDFTP